MSVLLLGKNGLFGQHFCKLYPDVIAIGHSECDITKQGDILDTLKTYRPSVIINAAGIVPKAREIHDTLLTLQTNSLAPRMLAELCTLTNCRLIHVSSNDVFSGRSGNYRESDSPNPVDLYGYSKALGEVKDFPHTTIRCSFVGYPDERGRGLLAWAANQQRLIGFDHFLWNGLVVTELVQLLMERIVPDSGLSGIIHLQGETLSKYDMIKQAAEVYGWTVEIVRESDVAPMPHISDRTLHVTRGIVSSKSFKQQLAEMKELWA